jgi:hypothetical protein
MHHDEDMDVEAGEPGHMEWGQRIWRERELRCWSQSEAVARLRVIVREQFGHELPQGDSLLRSWKRWESGAGIRPDYRRYLARLFDSVPGALFPPPMRIELLPDGDVAELLQQLQASKVDARSLEAVSVTVDTLCSEYPYASTEQLLFEGRRWLARLVALVREPMTLSQRRDVQVQAGWLALLVSCVQYDNWDTRGAELTRRHALSLGTEAGHAEIQGWAHEIAAWIALTSGKLSGVLTAVQGGLAVAGAAGVSVQLAAQKAKALARMANHREALHALDRGARQLEGMEYPTNPSHHFVIDPAKFDFYAMDVRRLSGDDVGAEHLAREILAAGRARDGSERTVMRCAEARLTLAIVAARRGDVEAAVHWALTALGPDRRSLPHLLMTAGELTSEIHAVAPNTRLADDFLDRVRQLGART